MGNDFADVLIFRKLFGGVDAAALSYELSPVWELQSSNVDISNISPSPASAAFAARMDRMITVAAKNAARVAARDFSCNQGAPYEARCCSSVSFQCIFTRISGKCFQLRITNLPVCILE